LAAVHRVHRRQRITIRGRLMGAEGQPLAAQRVTVWAQAIRAGSVPSRIVGLVTTDSNGRFAYRYRADMSRRLTFAYTGDNVIKPARAQARLAVRAGSTIRVHPRRAVNGQTVRFHGRVLGGHIPRRGALLVLQAFVRGQWHRVGTGAVFRSRRSGRWSTPYTFLATRGTVRWRFRVAILATGDYPFATGYSRPLTIVVRGL
jgi:hypothetical protein